MEIRGRKKDPFQCLKHKEINIPNRRTLAEREERAEGKQAGHVGPRSRLSLTHCVNRADNELHP